MDIYAGLIGQPVTDLDTPALVVDLDIMESNIARMASFFKEVGVRWRPHTKGVKIPAIAHKLLAAGAVGITCAKLSEAEVMVQGGIRDILIANQVVGPKKTNRLAALCRQADIIATVDSVENVRELDAAAQAWGVRIRTVVEVDIGGRCGVPAGELAIALAREVASRSGLRFVGFQGWEMAAFKAPPEKRKQAIEELLTSFVATAEACRKAGIPVEIVNCGGTPDYPIAARVPGVTECEAGGGIFGDLLYQHYGIDHPFALTVHSTVISRPNPTRVVTDTGVKSVSVDLRPPQPLGFPEAKNIFLSMEHAQFDLVSPSASPRIGERVVWVPGYADLALSMHDVLYGVRNGVVETAWPILGRGKFQ